MASSVFRPPPQVYQRAQPVHHQQVAYQQHGPPAAFQPAPIVANNSALDHGDMPQPTQEDLITAGIRYYATQAGNQNFR